MKKITKTTMVAATLFALMFAITNVNAQTGITTEKTYIKIVVDGLSCPFCAYGLEKKLKGLATAKDIQIELESGEATLYVSKNKQPTKEVLKKIVKEAGFTPKEISFSETPYETKDG